MKYETLLESFRNGPTELQREVRGISDELAEYRPFDSAWTIKEHVVHVTDTDINNFIRWKSIFAQPRSRAYAINEDMWVKNMKHTNADMNKYLTVLKLIREISYDYLIEVDEKEWNDEYFILGDSGMVTLEKCITIYANHVPSHVEYIRRNKKHWAERTR
jgi:hypothetical protein